MKATNLNRKTKQPEKEKEPNNYKSTINRMRSKDSGILTTVQGKEKLKYEYRKGCLELIHPYRLDFEICLGRISPILESLGCHSNLDASMYFDAILPLQGYMTATTLIHSNREYPLTTWVQ